MHFSLVKISHPDVPTHGFDDAMLPMFHALRRLGFSVEIRINEPNPLSRNIVFGSCTAPRKVGRILPANSIIVNLEQMVPGSLWMNNNYLSHLHDFTVWEYSESNLEVLHRQGITGAVLVPLGYVPEMTRLRTDFPEDIDVLFYGLVNGRRADLLSSLEKRGIRTYIAGGNTFGFARDRLIARAKIILNIHFIVPARLELVRLGYIWANKKAVVSERHEQTEVPEYLENACAYAVYEELEERVCALLADNAARKQQAEKGLELFAAKRLDESLKKVVGNRVFAAGGHSLSESSEGYGNEAGSLKESSAFHGRGQDHAVPSGVYLPGVSDEWSIVA